ncbi:hypothetical protein DSUL_40067 [Desulfovibrionales bacterium]
MLERMTNFIVDVRSVEGYKLFLLSRDRIPTDDIFTLSGGIVMSTT